MSVNGLLATLDSQYINRDKLLVFYDFMESGSVVNKAPSYSGNFSGLLVGDSSFYHASGTGYCTTGRVAIQNTGDLYYSDFTHIFSIRRTGNANDNFFSSLGQNSGDASGYMISSNDAGKLIFSYKDCHGPQSITSDFTLDTNSNFAITKRAGTVSFYQYTPVFNNLSFYNGRVNSSEIFPSDYADIFLASQLPAGFIKDSFSGFCFSYGYLKTALAPTQIMAIFTGIYSQVFSTPSGSGQTSGSVFVLPTQQTTVISGIAPSEVTLSKNGVVLLREFPYDSTVVVDYTTGNSSSSWNNQALYDSSKQNFVTQQYNLIPPIVFLNGQRVISGFSKITGQYCSTGRAFERDYQYSGSLEIFDGNTYDGGDIVIYDVPKRHTWQRLYSGVDSVNISTGSGIAVYLNGQRTLDYTISGTTLDFDQPLALTDVICIDYYENGYEKLGEIYSTGFFFTSGYFAAMSSRVFLNGQRLLLGQDYYEITTGTLFTRAPLSSPSELVLTVDSYDKWNL